MAKRGEVRHGDGKGGEARLVTEKTSLSTAVA
jgi:hypothetical protein